jgi:hypothetical protein
MAAWEGSVDFWFLYEVKNSQVTRIDLYASRMQAQQAAGLPD